MSARSFLVQQAKQTFLESIQPDPQQDLHQLRDRLWLEAHRIEEMAQDQPHNAASLRHLAGLITSAATRTLTPMLRAEQQKSIMEAFR
jgi:hypothetical protein